MRISWFFLGVFISIIILILVTGMLLPVNHSVRVTKQIDSSKQVIWNTISSPEAYPDWRSTITRVELLSDSASPLYWTEHYKSGDALSFREVSKQDSSLFISEIVNEGLPFGGQWTIELKEENNSTFVSITEDGEIYNPIFRFFARFIFGYESTISEYLSDLEISVN